MESSEPGTSASNTLGGEYEVFLSFRGPDTRHGFTSILYQAMTDVGIRVFIDDEELGPGEKISGDLLRAIDNSKLYIPIFSKTYASSHWCLRELAKMVDNTSISKEDEKKVILPIFYDVKPDDVKLNTKLYNEAIWNLKQQKTEGEKKFSSKDIEKWRKALQEVGGTKGWEPKKDSGYTEIIREVVEKVVVRLKLRERPVTKDLVGMDDRIAAINNLLDINSDSVQLIAIFGMGGIGKTTLAKTIFNQLCPQFGKNCSFLEDVREMAQKKNLKELQEKLLCDISYPGVACKILDIDHGIHMIEETICNKKTLIVLDDVDDACQIQKLIGENFLYPGTKILVTTRDKSVLNIRGYDFKYYEMVQLSDRDAIKLFSRHAFHDDSPPNNWYTLSRRIVSTADGLPLALQAIGSSLYGRKRKIWEEWLEKLKKCPHEDVLAKLRISYNGLDLSEREIFLDIACFFVGENKTNPMYMWNDCKFYPESAIEVLINKCMIKELDDNSLWMHNQFRDLGRVIAKEQHTRLWDIDDIINLNSPKTKESVQALRFKSRDPLKDPIIVTSEQIKQFPRIRFLSLCEVICQGDFTGCLSELKWISLDSLATVHRINMVNDYAVPPRPTSLWHLQNVVVLNLSGFDMTEDVFQSLIEGARKLKVLSLCYNTLIHGTSTFPRKPGLEQLTISKFFSLKEIDCFIGKLKKLTDLSFELCVELEKLPEQIGELRKLQHLSLRSCHSLRELPNSVLKLTSLTKLDVVGTRMTRLPDSIDRLSSLLSVNVSFTSIEKLPSTMSKLLCLRTLHLNNCDQMQELPKLPISLTTLQLTSTSLVTVPNLSYLTNLVELALSDGSESVAKSDIIQSCDMQWIESLSSLSKLQFCFSNVCISTIELGSLFLLKELTLHGVDVPAFKQLPSELIVLELYDTQGKQIQLSPLEKETAIVSSRSRELRENKVSWQIEIKCIEDHKSSEGWVHLLDEPGCNELQGPKLIDHWRGAFHLPSSLNMLRKFVLWGCPGVQDIQFVSIMESLLVFSIGGCTSLKRLGGLLNLKNLTELTLNRCWSLQFVEGINELLSLDQLKIDRCGSIERILDPLSSKIPDECSIHITSSGNLPDCCRCSGAPRCTWESYKRKILSGTESETTDSETETETESETGDAPVHLGAIPTMPQLSSIYQRSDSETET